MLLQDNESRTQSKQQSAPTGPMRRMPEVSEIRPGQSGDPNPYQDNAQGLTKRQLRRKRAKDTKIVKKIKSTDAKINNLKYQIEELEDKITAASKSTNARFKRNKIRSIKGEADKLSKALAESKKILESLKLRLPMVPSGSGPYPGKPHPPNRNKRLEVKIAELNKKICRTKNGRMWSCLIAKRDSLRLELNWGPRQLDGTFGGAYKRYQINGIEGMDVDTFFARTKRFLIDLLSRETRNRAARSQASTWVRFVKDEVEQVELAFNSRMLAVYNLSDMGEIVSAMIEHMYQQIENPALRDSKFVFDGVIHMDIDFHRLNLTRGSAICLYQTG